MCSPTMQLKHFDGFGVVRVLLVFPTAVAHSYSYNIHAFNFDTATVHEHGGNQPKVTFEGKSSSGLPWAPTNAIVNININIPGSTPNCMDVRRRPAPAIGGAGIARDLRIDP